MPNCQGQVLFRAPRMLNLALGCFAQFARLRGFKVNLDQSFSELAYQLPMISDENIYRELANRGAQFCDRKLIVRVGQKDEIRRQRRRVRLRGLTRSAQHQRRR